MLTTLLLSAAVLAAEPADARKHFTITVADEQTGRGVPLVELRTVNGIRLWTDSNGIVAFDEPGLAGHDVFFTVSSHGYEFAKDGFGYRGKALKVEPGGSAKLTIRRLNLAERLYRVTGAGVYRDSVLVGAKVPLKEPVLNGQVFGSDSVVNAVYRGKLYWFWGDTNRPGYPLGNFQVPSATSQLPSAGGLDPDRGVDLTYFVDAKGFAKQTMAMPGPGPTWLTSLVVLPDEKGRERMYGSFIKVKPPLEVYARGLAVWDDDREQFERVAEVDMKAPAFPQGHAFRHTDGGVEYVYFAHPFPLTRVRATAEHFLRVEDYETCTSLKDGQPDRYAWRKAAVGTGKKPGEGWRLFDRDTGKPVTPHGGSVYWNAYRKRWVMIVVQSAGSSSFLGEVWYAEADTPAGPWAYAVKVATHDRYSFYNPKQHPTFDADGGRRIYFEGTYTHTFSGNSDATPRYDYNQVMYRLDLADPRAVLPVAVYDRSSGDVPDTFGTAAKSTTDKVAFFAPDRPSPGAVAVLAGDEGLRLGKAEEAKALFYAVPPDAKAAAAATVPLYEYRQRDGTRRAYSVDGNLKLPAYERAEHPLCRVWRRPD